MSEAKHKFVFIGKQSGIRILKTGKEELRKLSFFTLISCLFLLLSANSYAQLVSAVKKGDVKEVEKLIAAGADVNKPEGPFRFTPLYWALKNKNPEMTKCLLDKGADVNKTVAYIQKKPAGTPIHVAVYQGSLEIVKLLVERGADIHVIDNMGRTPLDIAEEFNVLDPRTKTPQPGIYAPIIKALKDAEKKQSDNLALQNLQQYDSMITIFEPIAAKYRALKVKPPVSEEQRKYIVQANSLNQEKIYDKAIELYNNAIELDQTSYPEAYFNIALLSAQINRFDAAIFNMKKYLLLVPEAEDARAAQDKIYEWEAQIGK